MDHTIPLRYDQRGLSKSDRWGKICLTCFVAGFHENDLHRKLVK